MEDCDLIEKKLYLWAVWNKMIANTINRSVEYRGFDVIEFILRSSICWSIVPHRLWHLDSIYIPHSS